jgi:hypothetical protein
MAIRDALRSERGAQAFAEGLYAFLHGLQTRFIRWCEVVARLPRKQSRVLTWPPATVFGFIAQPDTHMFLKPTVTRLAAREYGFAFLYRPLPSWETYFNLLAFADEIRLDLRDLRPRERSRPLQERVALSFRNRAIAHPGNDVRRRRDRNAIDRDCR